MNADELHSLMHSPALGPVPSPETVEIVRGRAAVVRRQRRSTAGAVAVVVVATGLLVGPGIPDRLLPADRRSPPDVAAPRAESTGQAVLQVGYLPGSYTSVATEEAVARCAAPTSARVRLLAPTPAHVVTATGTPEELVALRACLAAIPGTTVTDVV
ncbi:MAG: hypothetical protein JWL64_557 [Frankiales bacterium]|nr:hypothetical protein [Frankiales bacterium]